MRLEPPGLLVEDKWVTTRDYELAESYVGHMQWLSLIEKGLEKSQRIGRAVHYNYLDFWCASRQPLWDTAYNTVPWFNRIVLLYDRQANGAALTPDDILDTVITPYEYRCMAPLRIGNPYRFIFFDDHRYAMQNYVTGGPATDMYHIKIDLSGLSAAWNDEGGYHTSCISGGIWAYFQSSAGATTTWSYTAELHFTDP